jgi:hypothetical protein
MEIIANKTTLLYKNQDSRFQIKDMEIPENFTDRDNNN